MSLSGTHGVCLAQMCHKSDLALGNISKVLNTAWSKGNGELWSASSHLGLTQVAGGRTTLLLHDIENIWVTMAL